MADEQLYSLKPLIYKGSFTSDMTGHSWVKGKIAIQLYTLETMKKLEYMTTRAVVKWNSKLIKVFLLNLTIPDNGDITGKSIEKIENSYISVVVDSYSHERISGKYQFDDKKDIGRFRVYIDNSSKPLNYKEVGGCNIQ